MSNNKMKGLLKGLRYISQIFDADEKEPEMEIGFPTDVKHVAHIGWDGPSVNSPSWMNEFKGQPGMTPNASGETKEDQASEEQSRRSTGSEAPNSPGAIPNYPRKATTNSARDLPELPKSSRRHSTSGGDSPTKAKSDRAKQTRRASKSTSKDNVEGANRSTRHHKDSSQGSDQSSNLPDIPKKSRRKKSTGGGGGSTSKSSRARAQASEGEGGSVSESVSQRGRRHASALSADETELGIIS